MKKKEKYEDSRIQVRTSPLRHNKELPFEHNHQRHNFATSTVTASKIKSSSLSGSEIQQTVQHALKTPQTKVKYFNFAYLIVDCIHGKP